MAEARRRKGGRQVAVALRWFSGMRREAHAVSSLLAPVQYSTKPASAVALAGLPAGALVPVCAGVA